MGAQSTRSQQKGGVMGASHDGVSPREAQHHAWWAISGALGETYAQALSGDPQARGFFGHLGPKRRERRKD